jgi:hypothetical protein
MRRVAGIADLWPGQLLALIHRPGLDVARLWERRVMVWYRSGPICRHVPFELSFNLESIER